VQFPLTGDRLELRPFHPSDTTAMHRIYSDRRVMRWVGDGPLTRLEDTEALLHAYIDHQRRHGFSVWALRERSSGALIGDAGLHVRAGEVELGYTLEARCWRRGYGSEAAALCVAAAFGPLGLRELIALVRPVNHRSAALLTRLGFQPSGSLTAYDRHHDLYRLSADAWPS
jgi:ribosomal-protein-alanine N-acetyltransferase